MQDQMPKYINYVPKYDYSELKRIWNIGKTTLQNKKKTIAMSWRRMAQIWRQNHK